MVIVVEISLRSHFITQPDDASKLLNSTLILDAQIPRVPLAQGR